MIATLILGPHCRQATPPKRPMALRLGTHDTTCVHRTHMGGEPCREPVATDKPHGWLCATHEGLVNRRRKVAA